MHSECQLAIQVASGTKGRNMQKEYAIAKKKDQNKVKLESQRDIRIKDKLDEANAIANEKKLDKVN
jgi:hypothetical protein